MFENSVKPLSLLLGVTLPFISYMQQQHFFLLLLSGPFLLLIAAVSGGLLYRGTSTRINDQLAKLLLIIGRLKDNSMKNQGTSDLPEKC